MFEEKKKQYNFIEVCAGAGGLSLGFIKTGFVPILLNDNNKYCCETLKINHPETMILNSSFTEINFDKYMNKDLDVLMGGVPCQSFSQAGKRKGLDDKRGNLIIEFTKVLFKLMPKFFLIENVKGLLTHNKGETLKKVLNILNKDHLYNIKYKVLNSNNYNVPQKRERLIIIGTRKDLKIEYLFPNEEKYKPILKDVLIDCPSSPGVIYNEYKYNIMKLVPPGGCWIDLPIEIQKEYMKKSYYSGGGKRGIARRLSMDKPSLTLLTSPVQKQTERCHPIETRPLQILEYKRIQTFPDNYKITGSLNQQYKQVGNAVPVNLSKALAKSIKDVLELT